MRAKCISGFAIVLIAAVCFTMLIPLSSCKTEYHKDVRIIDGYYSSDEHFDTQGFRDYTDYCEYYYDESFDDVFAESEYYHLLNEEDIEMISVYIENFSEWIKHRDGYEEWYLFDQEKQIKAGDYYYIAEDSELEFSNYDIYYYDMDKHTLYFFHNNG